MRRSIFAFTALSAAAYLMMGCEDGPNQTFKPAPSGAGDLQNGSPGTTTSDPTKGDFDAGFPGKSLQEICSADEKHARWAAMLTAPVVPPRLYAGIDMAKSDKWEGLTVEEAERINCQATNAGSDGAGHGGSYWGDNAEVIFWFDLGTHIVYQMVLQLGYTGLMSFKDKTGAHSYTMGIGTVITKDGQPFLIDWANAANRDAQLTELFNAAMSKNGPGFAVAPNYVDSANCRIDRGCLVINNQGGVGYFGIRPLSIYFNFRPNTPQPTWSTPFQIYNFYVKNEPYSNLPMSLKIDKEGPVAQGLVNATTTCKISLGLKYSDFVKNCVRTTGVPALDDQNVNKLLGGRTHDFENFQFNVIGVNQNFTHVQGPMSVIQDSDLPGDNDVGSDWIFDVRAKGIPSNELTAGGSEDLHGSGLLYREWARLVQADMNAILQANGVPQATHQLGDGACLVASPPVGCTGFEGIVLPGVPEGDVLDGQLDGAGFYRISALAPGDPSSVFCLDATTTQQNCNIPGPGYPAPLWDSALQWVTRILGHGDTNNMPGELRDRRYFFKWYAHAMVKYLKAYGVNGASLTPAQVAATTYDYDSLFFDNSFGAQFDKLEYIERSFMDSTTPVALDFEYGTDVKVANQRYTNWYRRMDREEAAMFTVMLTDKTHLPGQENNVNLTNLYGSPVLKSLYSSYHCATVNDPGTCKSDPGYTTYGGPLMRSLRAGWQAPYSDNTPALRFYPGAWSNTIFSQGHSTIHIDKTDGNLLAATVTLPNFANPYNTVPSATNKPTPLQALVPWIPAFPTNGFSVPITATRDKAIVTQTLDFTGVQETYLVDYEMYKDFQKPFCHATADCNAGFTCNTSSGTCEDGTIVVDAIEAPDFLGDVFLCSDPTTGEVLHARMYTSAASIVDWIAAHPGAQDGCDIVLRYSVYNNYLDYITSRVNGVKVNINQGAGFGRVVDATLFDTRFLSQ